MLAQEVLTADWLSQGAPDAGERPRSRAAGTRDTWRRLLKKGVRVRGGWHGTSLGRRGRGTGLGPVGCARWRGQGNGAWAEARGESPRGRHSARGPTGVGIGSGICPGTARSRTLEPAGPAGPSAGVENFPNTPGRNLSLPSSSLRRDAAGLAPAPARPQRAVTAPRKGVPAAPRPERVAVGRGPGREARADFRSSVSATP